MKAVIAAVLSLGLVACASSHVLVGTKRAPIDPAAVKVYLQPPAKYEQVALLEANSSASFAVTKQGKSDKVVERLKAEAAALGANGVLIQGMGTETTATVGTVSGTSYGSGYTGVGVGAPVTHAAGSAIAIYVTE